MGSAAETPTSQIAKDSILEGPFWPGPVRVIRVEPVGATRIKIEAVSLDGEERLITRLLKREELAQVKTVSTIGQLAFDGDALHIWWARPAGGVAAVCPSSGSPDKRMVIAAAEAI